MESGDLDVCGRYRQILGIITWRRVVESANDIHLNHPATSPNPCLIG